MAAKRCKKQQMSFGNSTKYSDFIDGKYFLRNQRLKGSYCSKKIASSKKNCWYFLLKFLVSALIDIINMPEEFKKNRWSRSPWLKVAQNSAVKLFWNFKNKLLSGRRRHLFQFSGQVNSTFTCCYITYSTWT